MKGLTTAGRLDKGLAANELAGGGFERREGGIRRGWGDGMKDTKEKSSLLTITICQRCTPEATLALTATGSSVSWLAFTLTTILRVNRQNIEQ